MPARYLCATCETRPAAYRGKDAVPFCGKECEARPPANPRRIRTKLKHPLRKVLRVSNVSVVGTIAQPHLSTAHASVCLVDFSRVFARAIFERGVSNASDSLFTAIRDEINLVSTTGLAGMYGRFTSFDRATMYYPYDPVNGPDEVSRLKLFDIYWAVPKAANPNPKQLSAIATNIAMKHLPDFVAENFPSLKTLCLWKLQNPNVLTASSSHFSDSSAHHRALGVLAEEQTRRLWRHLWD